MLRKPGCWHTSPLQRGGLIHCRASVLLSRVGKLRHTLLQRVMPFPQAVLSLCQG